MEEEQEELRRNATVFLRSISVCVQFSGCFQKHVVHAVGVRWQH